MSLLLRSATALVLLMLAASPAYAGEAPRRDDDAAERNDDAAAPGEAEGEEDEGSSEADKSKSKTRPGPALKGELTFILAAAMPAKVDRRLKAMEKDLRRAFAGRFRRFDFVSQSNPHLASGKARSFELPGGGELSLTYKGREGPYLRLRIEMPGFGGDVRVQNAKRFFQAGRKHKDGTLVIGILLDAE
jgi:hypothetical protein